MVDGIRRALINLQTRDLPQMEQHLRDAVAAVTEVVKADVDVGNGAVDVLLYDHLVIRYPPDGERPTWIAQGWKPDRLEACLGTSPSEPHSRPAIWRQKVPTSMLGIWPYFNSRTKIHFI